ncbi:hypothetical protein FA95DRAFT_1506252 [Auriscalpium vulgare]|uniref:Uncharacterized protein n=1 Tax=Auriscalpium vulgare TaxID=40419 RepID=A0ACB8R1R1_9AGAM|nr:hypothetical protein FA95DRAFT_1506252 [Auriscalpium vulgare]
MCLGRDQHDVGHCNRARLWDDSRATRCTRNARDRLAVGDTEICLAWQLPNGCQSTNHLERHACSGCGDTSHGANGCPLAQEA